MRHVREPRLTFGVDDPHGHHLYTLRQSRYDAIASDINDWACAARRDGQALSVLDVGCGDGTLLRYLETKPEFGNVVISAADLRVDRWLYKKEAYHEIFIGDLHAGYSQIPSDYYDVVVCEQVLEHLNRTDAAIRTLARLVKPGGKLVVGVPVFPPPLHLIRKHIIPRLDRIFAVHKTRGHEQAFSEWTILAELRQLRNMQLLEVRGFRVISGGLLRPLENYRWWWRLNRAIGEAIPALCIEIQVIMQKGQRVRRGCASKDVDERAASCVSGAKNFLTRDQPGFGGTRRPYGLALDARPRRCAVAHAMAATYTAGADGLGAMNRRRGRGGRCGKAHREMDRAQWPGRVLPAEGRVEANRL